MVAVQAVAIAVLHQPGRALRAIETVAAGPAQGQRGIAAAVEIQQRLLLVFERLRDGSDQRRREPFALLGRLLAHIDGHDIGQLDAGIAARQDHAAVAAGARIDVALDGRRGRRQDHRELAEIGAHHSHVARLVVHAVFLLEAAVVLFVDDDETEFVVGQEQRRAGADHDAGFARRRGAPGPRALRRGERGMPLDRHAAEACREAVHELAGERDLRQHDERLTALLQRACHRLEVDCGLAGAGDAIEQRDGEGTVGCRAHGVHRACLRIGEVDRGVRRIGAPETLLRDRHFDQAAGFDEAVDHAGGSSPPRSQAHSWPGSGRRRRSRGRACAPGSCGADRPHPRLQLTPKRGFTGSNTADEPIIMRATMPSWESV